MLFSVGDATIVRVEETNLPTYPLREIFPEFSDAHLAEHGSWLAPHHYEAEIRAHQARRSQLAVAGRWQENPDRLVLRQQQGQAGAAVLAHAQFALSRAARRCRRASGGNRPRHVHASASRSCRLEHLQKDGKWVPTFPNARYVFSKPDVDYFSRIDADPKEGPAELGTFRECVVPILEHGKADLVSGGPASAQRVYRDRTPRRAIRLGMCSSNWKARVTARPSSGTCGITSCKSIIRTGTSRRIPTRRRRRSAGVKCWTIAPRAARWCFRAMWACRLPAASKRLKKAIDPNFPP